MQYVFKVNHFKFKMKLDASRSIALGFNHGLTKKRGWKISNLK